MSEVPLYVAVVSTTSRSPVNNCPHNHPAIILEKFSGFP